MVDTTSANDDFFFFSWLVLGGGGGQLTGKEKMGVFLFKVVGEIAREMFLQINEHVQIHTIPVCIVQYVLKKWKKKK